MYLPAAETVFQVDRVCRSGLKDTSATVNSSPVRELNPLLLRVPSPSKDTRQRHRHHSCVCVCVTACPWGRGNAESAKSRLKEHRRSRIFMGLAEPFALKRSFLELMRHKEALTGVRAGFG